MIKSIVLPVWILAAGNVYAAPDMAVSSSAARPAAAMPPRYVFVPDTEKFSRDDWMKKADKLVADYSAAGGKQQQLLRDALNAPYSYDDYAITGLSPEMTRLLDGKDLAALPALLYMLDALRIDDLEYSRRGNPQSALVYGILGMNYERTSASRRRLMRTGPDSVRGSIAKETLTHDPQNSQARKVLKKLGLESAAPTPAAYGVKWGGDFTHTALQVVPPDRIIGGKTNRFEIKTTNNSVDGIKNSATYMVVPKGAFVLAHSGEALTGGNSLTWLHDAIGPGESRTEWVYLQLPADYSFANTPIECGLGDFNRMPNDGPVALVTFSGE